MEFIDVTEEILHKVDKTILTNTKYFMYQNIMHKLFHLVQNFCLGVFFFFLNDLFYFHEVLKC